MNRISIPAHLRPLAIGVGLGAVSTLLGMHIADGLLVGLVTGVLATVWMTAETGTADTWRAAAPADAPGARRELATLTWAFLGRDGRVSEAAVRRLRVLATRRLARSGLVVVGGVGPGALGLDHPTRDAAREALGERAWTVLTAPGGWMPSLADITHCVDVIEKLPSAHPTRPADSTRPTERPTP